MLKKLLPFEELVYRSTFTKEELVAYLQNEIEAEKSFGLGANRFSYSKPYIGKVYQNRFGIKKAINYRNSFLPVIKGEIVDDINGSKINVKMGLIDFVKAFMILWLGGVSIACLAVSYNIIFGEGLNSETGIFMLIPFFMLIIGIVMVSFGFKFESRKSIIELEEILKAKIVQ